jgi:hypothetical protein
MLDVPSFASEDKLDLTLRVREMLDFRATCVMSDPETEICIVSARERVWTDEADRHAVQRAYTVRYTTVDDGFSAIDYGGRTMPTGWWWEGELTDPSTTRPVRFEIDGGSTVALEPEQGVWAGGRTHECAAVAGRWSGTAGDLENRTGTFTMINDSLQSTLHLVED